MGGTLPTEIARNPPPRHCGTGAPSLRCCDALAPAGFGANRSFCGSALDRCVQFAAIDEDERCEIEEHERDHAGGKPGVIGDVGVRELGEVETEGGARAEPQTEGHENAWRDLRPGAPARPQ